MRKSVNRLLSFIIHDRIQCNKTSTIMDWISFGGSDSTRVRGILEKELRVLERGLENIAS